MNSERLGVLLVFFSALCWSIGGTLERMVDTPLTWTIVFWRSFWAAAFILAFMFWRDGLRGTVSLFRNMGWPGFGVASCFAFCSAAFVVALSYTTVANVLLIQAGVPLFAALMTFLLFREHISVSTWAAIAAVIGGVAIMVSDSFNGQVSPIGDGLSILIAMGAATATVITRRYAHVRMTPATCLGAAMAGVLAAGVVVVRGETLLTSMHDAGWLFLFGAVNLGLGLALFATGVRLVPAALAALVGTFDPILGPIWVWLVHGETPSFRTILGGAIVMAALLIYLALQFGRRSGKMKNAGQPAH